MSRTSQRATAPVVDEAGPQAAEPPAVLPRSARPAAESFGDRVWAARADLLERQAELLPTPELRSRTLLVASELWSIDGDSTRARAAAKSAAALAPGASLAARQARWLEAEQGHWDAVEEALAAEIKASSDAAQRCHAALYSATIQRFVHGDPATEGARLEVAAHADPLDPRPPILRSIAELAADSAAPRKRPPEGEHFAYLGDALARLRRHRGAPAAPGSELAPPAGVFGTLRAALAHHDAGQYAGALASLRDVDALAFGAGWLRSCVLNANPTTRAQGIEELRQLVSEHPSVELNRCLLARLQESGHGELAPHLADTVAHEVLSPAERMLLGLLNGLPVEELQRLAVDTDAEAVAQPLAAALGELAHYASPESLTRGMPNRRALGAALGHALAQDTDTNTLPSFAVEPGAEAWEHAVGIELALRSGSGREVLKHLAEWGSLDEVVPQATRHLAAALLAEMVDERELAQDAYTRVVHDEPTNEGALRAAGALRGGLAADELQSLADLLDGHQRVAFLLLEAAALAEQAGSSTSSLLDRAADAEPLLPFPYRRGELNARREAKLDDLVRWLQRRRDASDDTLERGLDLVREALALVAHAPESARAALSEAVASRPEDVALRELAERLDPDEMAPSRAEWREAHARDLRGTSRTAWLLEAARHYERAQDIEGAARAAREARQEDPGSELAQLMADRLALAMGEREPMIVALNEHLSQGAAPELTADWCTALADWAERDGDPEQALMWSERALDAVPGHPRGLRRWEALAFTRPTPPQLVALAKRVEAVSSSRELSGYRALASHWFQLAGDSERALDQARRARAEDHELAWPRRPLLWAAESLDDTGLAEQLVGEILQEAWASPLDRSAQHLAAAQLYHRTEQLGLACSAAEHALDAAADNWAAAWLRASALGAGDAHASAAIAWEALADSTPASDAKGHALEEAGKHWFQEEGGAERGIQALESALQLAPERKDLFERLRESYLEHGLGSRLLELLNGRLAVTGDPDERAALQFARGEALLATGDAQEARAAFSESAEAGHSQAALALVDVCERVEDWESAEQALRSVAESAASSEQRVASLRKLSRLYSGPLAAPERAIESCERIQQLLPEDLDSALLLARLLARNGRAEHAASFLTERIDLATEAATKRDLTLELAAIQESSLEQPHEAERTYERARRSFPGDATVLSAYAGHWVRRNNKPALGVLMERASNEARRALVTGRFQIGFFETLETVARLRGDPHSARIVASSVAALRGEELTLDGAGATALDGSYDDLIAPDQLSLPLRALLRNAGWAIDETHPFDLDAARAEPPPQSTEPGLSQLCDVAASVGVTDLEILVAPHEGAVCLPIAGQPPRVVFGQALLENPDVRARDFLFARAIKLLQVQGAALSRLTPIELWPALAAWLSALAPSWQPQGLAATSITQARGRIEAVLPPVNERPTDWESLAIEVADSIGSRAAQVGAMIQHWSNRSALLAVGSPTAALRALAAAAAGQGSLPSTSEERVRWIVRHVEARDLLVFTTTEAYADARRRLGLEA